MRNLLLGCAALLILATANAPRALAFETQYDQGTNPTGSARYADPDEQFDALADGAGGGSPLIFNFGAGNVAWSHQQTTAAVADHSVRWSPERIRTVFGPDAHY